MKYLISPFAFMIVCILLTTNTAFSETVTPLQERNNYVGTIGDDLKIGMTLIFNGKEVTGTYFYNKWLKDIVVKGVVDNDRRIVLSEYDQNGQVTGIFKGNFIDKTPGYYEQIEGFWSLPNGAGSRKFRASLSNAGAFTPGEGRYSVAGFNNDKDVDLFIQRFWKAVIKKDKVNIAGMIHYPVDVYINGKQVKIKNQTEFLKSYDQIFYSSFYKRIKNAVPHNVFANYQGVMLGDGEVWFGTDGKNSYVIAINNGEWK